MFKGRLALTLNRPTPPMPTQGTGGVIFYEHVDYGGTPGQVLAKGTYTRAQLQAAGVRDNSASSVRAPPGWTVTAYAEDNLAGQSGTWTANTPNFTLSPNANDHLTSCRIE